MISGARLFWRFSVSERICFFAVQAGCELGAAISGSGSEGITRDLQAAEGANSPW
jgi:hypothetical protein